MSRFIQDIKTLQKGNWVRRSHTVPVLHEQTVAHHQCSAAQLAVMLGGALSMRRESIHSIVIHLLSHDIAEGYTGDVPADVKMNSQRVSEALSMAESAWEVDNFPEEFYTGLRPDESRLAKLCDWFDLLIYCRREQLLGNTHPDFKQMHINIFSYLRKSIESYESYRYCGEIQKLLEDNQP